MAGKYRLPVLPIPNVVFYPNTALPLLVVEPIYRRMINDCIEKNLNLGIALAEPVGVNTKDARWVPHKICTMGKPIIIEELPDGSLKVLVRGLARVRLKDIKQNIPYMIFDAEAIQDFALDESFDSEGKIERLSKILDQWVLDFIPDSLERDSFYHNLVDTKHIVDYVCMFLIQDRELRQLLLENMSLIERIQMLDTLLPGHYPMNEDALVGRAIKEFEHIEKIASCAH
ncbi:MAG: hypothetical protein COW00_17035 [Bdellovibrio sp. CG12_big_fil_rev_8_21_14_0_65_39_13]|nr:MAG: hypothetical protein COW78_00205 [Bdellovibrio sp. CG22_combo_CG10-13_8_21_14_all_39_27]PIQ58140.1 MAG: hypothetical protein COW00_17035 [Bdellovibrio sp. CG12_big_fil_rev_8_21_14_0_65_39_13]PIR34302.1 MAG: hypothetical protein COV37_13275 [Bdellovibrio sp. CG11_big_fil_rev_8_21_14_0_20_39_38]PJB53209.1 MAG: hypothetical protein CO099_08370 [Bdellovibrio sp. CG_4_9_14_3_um_filter_39_7]